MSTQAEVELLRELTSHIIKPTLKNGRQPVKLMSGVVTRLMGSGALEVILNGDGYPIPNIRHLDAYSPVVGDVVWILKNGPDYLALGDLRNLLTNAAGRLARPAVVGTAGAPSYANGWSGGNGTLHRRAHYWKDFEGVVHLSGHLRDGTVGQAAFTLPDGYRPATRLEFSQAGWNIFATNDTGNYCEVYVGTNGNVVVNSCPFGSNNGVSLEGIKFIPGGISGGTYDKFNANMIQPLIPLGVTTGGSNTSDGGYGAATPGRDIERTVGFYTRDDGWSLGQGWMNNVEAGAVAHLPEPAHYPVNDVFAQWSWDGSTNFAKRIDLFGATMYSRTASNEQFAMNGFNFMSWKAADKWIDLADEGFLNATNWRPWGSAYARPAMMKDRYGTVHLRGLVEQHSTASGGGGTDPWNRIVTFPEEYSPPFGTISLPSSAGLAELNRGRTCDSHGSGHWLLCRDYSISSTDPFWCLRNNAAGVGRWLSLAGISFRTDANAITL